MNNIINDIPNMGDIIGNGFIVLIIIIAGVIVHIMNHSGDSGKY